MQTHEIEINKRYVTKFGTTREVRSIEGGVVSYVEASSTATGKPCTRGDTRRLDWFALEAVGEAGP